MIVHRGLSNYLAWALRAYRVGEGAGSPVHSSVAFDLTVTSLFLPLLAGRRVDLLAEDLGVEALAEALRSRSGYSLVKITPAHLQLLGQQLGPAGARGGRGPSSSAASSSRPSTSPSGVNMHQARQSSTSTGRPRRSSGAASM